MPATIATPTNPRNGRPTRSSSGTVRRKGFQNYAEAFQASWTDRADAAALLAMVAASPTAPAIARASALSELHSRVSPANIELARKGLADPDPMVRIGGA